MLSIDQKIKLHKELLDQLHETYIAKNHDYGDSVHETYKKYGMTSFLVRVEDKINRVRTLTKEGFQAVNDEKISDSLLDAANYLILAAIELEEDKSNKTSYTVSLGMDAIHGSSITYGKQGITTPTTATLSTAAVRNGKLVSYEEHEEEIPAEGGIHIYEYGSNSNKTN